MGPGVLNELLSGLPKFSDENLLVGLGGNDDAAVYRVADGLAAVQTVDYLPPIVDDAFKFGRIAAANALSDIYAMGVKPRIAMNLFFFNVAELELEVAHDILAGGADAIIEAGAVLVGGQSISDTVPKYGLCVTGFAQIDTILTNSGARPGDVLILTKAIGTGIVMGAMREDAASGEVVDVAVAQMCRLNKYSAEALDGFEVHACTDVTGFGLLGHATELAKASGVTLEIDYRAVPKLPQAEELAREGYAPCQAQDNYAYVKDSLDDGDSESYELTLLADPQTSGGLLFSLPEEVAQTALERLRIHDPDSAVIGRVAGRGEYAIRLTGGGQ